MAKARVRPLKVTTIPKLELQAASLLARLLVYAANTLQVPHTHLQLWTDSTIVLSWLRKMPHSISDVFVKNRISTIHESLQDAMWRHVPSGQNPADIASRGSSVADLLSSSLWWSGPSWLSCPEDSWPSNKAAPLPRSLPGVQATVLTTALKPVEAWDLWTRCSSYTHLVRIWPGFGALRATAGLRPPESATPHSLPTSSPIPGRHCYFDSNTNPFPKYSSGSERSDPSQGHIAWPGWSCLHMNMLW